MHETKYLSRENCKNYEYVNRFINKENNYNRQYSHIYFERLLIYRPLLIDYCKEKYGNKYEVKKLHEISSTKSSMCIVIGTLYKQMALRPTILKKLADDYIPNEPVYGKYVKPSDVLIIEDELQRAQLVGNIPKDILVTGVTIGVLCFEDRGCLNVQEYIYPPLPTQIPRPLTQKSHNLSERYFDPAYDRYVAIVSGLGLSKENMAVNRIQLLIDTLTGRLDGDEDSVLARDMAQVVRLVIAGNSLSHDVHEENLITRAKYISQKLSLPSFEYMKTLDGMLSELAAGLSVDIMPGKHDPTGVMFPQQPLHQCLFPHASKFSSFNTVSNPYEFLIGGVRFLGTSGQNIDDIYQFSQTEDRLEILENTLKWTHIAPTSPDSLPCYPFFSNEPFIIKHCPDVYFAGNAKEFKWKHYEGERGQKVLLVTVPEFVTTSTVVLVNLMDLSCRSITFDTSNF